MEQLTAVRSDRKLEMDQPQFEVVRLVEGLGFGDGSITTVGINPELLLKIDQAISSPDILIAVGKNDAGDVLADDGCGDGRHVELITKAQAVLKRSLHRSKVFGGGVAMGVATLVGLGRASGQPLESVFENSMANLQTNKIDFGAHTDSLEHPGASGCGAIDRSPQSIAAAVHYESQIRGVIDVLGVDPAGIDEVFENYRKYAAEIANHNGFNGYVVVNKIKQLSKVVKQLGGTHKERRIILNTVPGFTVNQYYVRNFTDDEGQVFAVDTWRLEEIATKLYDNDEQVKHQALLSELVYMLGVAAVLTDGTLPVDIIKEKATLNTV